MSPLVVWIHNILSLAIPLLVQFSPGWQDIVLLVLHKSQFEAVNYLYIGLDIRSDVV